MGLSFNVILQAIQQGFFQAIPNSWTLQAATVNTSGTAPDGVTTAYKVAETATSGTHEASQSVTCPLGTYSFVVTVKDVERSRVVLRISDFATGDATFACSLQDGSPITYDPGVGTWTNVSGGVRRNDDGSWRVKVTGTRNSGSVCSIKIQLMDDFAATFYAGVAGLGLLFWNAQLVGGDSWGRYGHNEYAFGTATRLFAADSLWNARPINPTLGSYVLPTTTYDPTAGQGAYSTGAFVASVSDGPMTVTGSDGTPSTLWNPDERVSKNVTIPRWPAGTLPAQGTDGHADIIDPITGIVHSFYQLSFTGGQWRSSQYSWSPMAGTGWGDPAHSNRGARATGVASSGGLMRISEVIDGDSIYRHALAMTLDYSALSANPTYVFPATSADSDAATTNTGSIPEGALMMLPSTFDTSFIANAQLKKMADTLKVFGARVVDRNVGTRFAIFAENGSAFNLNPNGYDPVIASNFQTIAGALRMVTSVAGWVDGNGYPFTPNQKLPLLAMRGPWTLVQGATLGTYNTYTGNLDFPSDPAGIVQGQVGGGLIDTVTWDRFTVGTQYKLTVYATGGAQMRFYVRDSSFTPIYDSGFLGNGQTVTFTCPTGYNSVTLDAKSAANMAGSVRGELLPN